MHTVVETTEFVPWASRVWRDDERYEFIDWISAHPLAGDAISGAGGLPKVRWRRAGIGKRGGVRVIYFNQHERGEVVLLIVYAKAKFDNLGADILVRLTEKFDGGRNRKNSN